jgi:dolichol-phosphate mannosyltransferase
VYNEAQVLHQLYDAVTRSLGVLGCRLEVVFVNDGSTDGSEEIMDELAGRDARVQAVHFSRNFGHQAAVQAGLTHARGDAVIVMDSDLQDDPRCLVEFVRQWQAGYDVVYAIRQKRKEGAVKRALFFAFYRLLNLVSETPIPNDAGNFGLVDRQVATCIRELSEQDRYYSGLRSWVGFRQIGVPVERLPRHDDRPRVSLYGLCRLAKTAIFSFSSIPLLVFYAIGGLSFLVCGLFTAFSLYHKFATGLAIPGWTSTITIASFFGALNALGIAVLGEYVVRIYDQVRKRPKFLVARHEYRRVEPDAKLLEERVQESLAELSGVSAWLGPSISDAPDMGHRDCVS